MGRTAVSAVVCDRIKPPPAFTTIARLTRALSGAGPELLTWPGTGHGLHGGQPPREGPCQTRRRTDFIVSSPCWSRTLTFRRSAGFTGHVSGLVSAPWQSSMSRSSARRAVRVCTLPTAHVLTTFYAAPIPHVCTLHIAYRLHASPARRTRLSIELAI